MNKTELVAAIAEEQGITKKAADENVTAVMQGIINALSEGESVALIGFGKFEVKTVAAHTGHNPQTGENMEIPEHNRVSFRAGKIFKESVQ